MDPTDFVWGEDAWWQGSEAAAFVIGHATVVDGGQTGALGIGLRPALGHIADRLAYWEEF